jgi:hypothetical protein
VQWVQIDIAGYSRRDDRNAEGSQFNMITSSDINMSQLRELCVTAAANRSK